jgi:glycine/D-amino acid oxidase-like deaminating enzyme
MSQRNSTCDVIIIGGGVIGLSTAYEWANAGLKVRVL